jgi:hypothetical protein
MIVDEGHEWPKKKQRTFLTTTLLGRKMTTSLFIVRVFEFKSQVSLLMIFRNYSFPQPNTSCHYFMMAEVSNTYTYDLVLPKKDILWSAIVNKEHNEKQQQKEQQQQLSALTQLLLSEIQQYDKHRVHKPHQQKFIIVLKDDIPPIRTLASSTDPTSSADGWNNSLYESPWTCAICLDNLPVRNPNDLSIPCNTCQFCVPCMTQYLHLQIEEKTTNMTANWTIRCPCLLDGCEVSTLDIEKVLSAGGTDEYDAETKTKMLAKFHKFALDLEIQHDPSKVFCPGRDCSGVATIPSSSSRRRLFFSSHNAKCQDCKHSFCIKCHNSHGRFTSCDNVSESQFNTWRRTTRQGCKKCPGCRMYIEKNDGCNHMSCRACGAQFCWICLGNIHNSGSIKCKMFSIGAKEFWGDRTVTRAVTKTLAVPGALTAGGVAIGVAGIAAGVAVAGAGLLLCSFPFYAGYRFFELSREDSRRSENVSVYEPTAIFRRGIIIVLPPSFEGDLLDTVHGWAPHMLNTVAGDPPAGYAIGGAPYAVAYTGSYVLYFTTTPFSVPGYELADDEGLQSVSHRAPLNLAEEEELVQILTARHARGSAPRRHVAATGGAGGGASGSDSDNDVQPPVVNLRSRRRAYIRLSSEFVKSCTPAEAGERLTVALNDHYREAYVSF